MIESVFIVSIRGFASFVCQYRRPFRVATHSFGVGSGSTRLAINIPRSLIRVRSVLRAIPNSWLANT